MGTARGSYCAPLLLLPPPSLSSSHGNRGWLAGARLTACMMLVAAMLLHEAAATASPCAMANVINGVDAPYTSTTDSASNVAIIGCGNVVNGDNVTVTGNHNTVSGNTYANAMSDAIVVTGDSNVVESNALDSASGAQYIDVQGSFVTAVGNSVEAHNLTTNPLSFSVQLLNNSAGQFNIANAVNVIVEGNTAGASSDMDVINAVNLVARCV